MAHLALTHANSPHGTVTDYAFNPTWQASNTECSVVSTYVVNYDVIPKRSCNIRLLML